MNYILIIFFLAILATSFFVMRIIIKLFKWLAGYAILIIFNFENWILKTPVNFLTKLVTDPKKIAKLAQHSGQDKLYSPERVLGYKEISFWLAVLATLILLLIFSVDSALFIGGLLVYLAWRWPELYLLRKIARLRKEANKSLPHLIDLLKLYTLAGKNLEGALRQAGNNIRGFWGTKMRQLVYYLDIGLSFDEALNKVKASAAVADFDRLIAVLKQAQVLGASISSTLSIHGALLKTRRRQEAEEAARTASVKIALPLVLCIFPALLIIYLAPAVLRVINGL